MPARVARFIQGASDPKAGTMVRPIIIALAAVPAVVAALIAIPMLTQTEIPASASNPGDRMEIEYTRHHLERIPHDITDGTAIQKTEILLVGEGGELEYVAYEGGITGPGAGGQLDEPDARRLAALIKETGFMTIQPGEFPILDNATEYRKHAVRVTLNGETGQVYWPEQNATAGFVPPIIVMVGSELDRIMDGMRE